MNKFLKFFVWSCAGLVLSAGIIYYATDIFEEKTIIPATEYDTDAQTPTATGSNSSATTGLSQQVVDTSLASADNKTKNKVTTDHPTLESSAVAVGRQLKPSDFHINHKLNARLRFTNFLNTFKDGDYVTGKDLARVYGADKEINSVVRKLVVSYFEQHIDYIKRERGELIINTVDQKPAITRIHVPLLIDVNVTIDHGSKIILGKTFIAKEKNFLNVFMLPLNLQGISIKQSDESIPSKGYVSGDNYYINYSGSTDCYKLK